MILIDSGAGPHFMPTAGKLLDNMETVGIKPESITKVVYTHAHPDHIWGTLDDFDESPEFSQRELCDRRSGVEFLDVRGCGLQVARGPKEFRPGRQTQSLAASRTGSGPFNRAKTSVGGLWALDTSGHTAGHIAIEVASGGEALTRGGDVLTHPVISFAASGLEARRGPS